MSQLAPDRIRGELRDAPADRIALRHRDRISSAQADHMRSVEARQRLAECSSRENMFETKWLERVEQHNINLARQAAMLKAIIQYENLRSRFGNRPLGGSNAISVLEMWHTGKGQPKLERFVV